MRRRAWVMAMVCVACTARDEVELGEGLRQPLTVTYGSTANGRFGSSIAGCGSFFLAGVPGSNRVFHSSQGNLALPVGGTFGRLVACTSGGEPVVFDDDGGSFVSSAGV